jgi:hypothetical protein
VRKNEPGQDVEIWLARQAIANATMDPPDVDGFMRRFGDALLRAVQKIDPGTALNAFASMPDAETLNLAKSYSEWMRETLGSANCTYPARYALVSIFIEWMSGGLKSKYARKFIISTCHEAMAAGV